MDSTQKEEIKKNNKQVVVLLGMLQSFSYTKGFVTFIVSMLQLIFIYKLFVTFIASMLQLIFIYKLFVKFIAFFHSLTDKVVNIDPDRGIRNFSLEGHFVKINVHKNFLNRKGCFGNFFFWGGGYAKTAQKFP